MKTVILLHGYNANEQNWEQVVWGVPPDQPGRIPTAVSVALQENADLLLLWGSSLGKEINGEWFSSGRLMTDLLFARFDTLPHFNILSHLISTSFEDFEQFRVKFTQIYELIENPYRAPNTKGELEATRNLIKERKLEVRKLICISSPDHVSRIIRDALIVFEGSSFVNNISVQASSTLYTKDDGKTPPERANLDNVVIAEPRAPVVPIFQRILKTANNPDALTEIEEILNKYEK